MSDVATGIVVEPGINFWRVYVTAETGWTSDQVRQKCAVFVAQWLNGKGATWWKWDGGQTDVAIASGNARPIQAFKAVKTSTRATKIPSGRLLGANPIPQPTGPVWQVDPPLGYPTVWVVDIEFHWRGTQKVIGLPHQGGWPRIEDARGGIVATVNVAIQPKGADALSQAMPDRTRGENSQQKWEGWWNQTQEDASKTPLAVPLYLTGATPGKKGFISALPWLLLAGGALYLLGSAGGRPIVVVGGGRRRR